MVDRIITIDWRNLNNKKITNRYLYGQETEPVNYDDRVRPVNADRIRLQLDSDSFLTDGPVFLPVCVLWGAWSPRVARAPSQSSGTLQAPTSIHHWRERENDPRA